MKWTLLKTIHRTGPIQPNHIDNAILQEFDDDMQFPEHNVQIPQPANENGPHEVQIDMHDHNYVQIPQPANDNAPHEVQIDMHDHNYVQIPQPANDNVPHEVQIDMHEHNYFQPLPVPQEIEIAENLVPHVQPDHIDNAIPQEFVEDMPFAQENLEIAQPPQIDNDLLQAINNNDNHIDHDINNNGNHDVPIDNDLPHDPQQPVEHDIYAAQNLNDENFLRLRQNFHNKVNAIKQLHCLTCNEKIFIEYNARVQRCRRCSANANAEVNKFSADNNMDPGHVPPQLQGLTPVEKLLIAKVNPTMTIHRLSRGGQFGFKGHVLNLSQNVNAFLRQLPRTVHQLDVLVLRKENHNAELPPAFFTVNRQRVPFSSTVVT